MKKQLTITNSLYRGQMRALVSIRNFRKVYSNEIKKHPALVTTIRIIDGKDVSSGIRSDIWQSEIGIMPVKPDGASKRTFFLLDELSRKLEELKWEPDNMAIDSDPEVTEEEPESGNEDYFSAQSVHGLLLGMLNQKLDFIIESLGGGFELDESKLPRRGDYLLQTND